MIRKITALLSAAVLLCSLTACGNKPAEQNGGAEQTSDTATGSGILELDGRKVITLEALSEHVEIAEITTENWKDYFEIVSSDSEYLLQVRTGGRRYDYTSTLNIDFTNQKTGRIFGGTSDNGQPYICKFDEETSIDDLECQILSPAKIILADIPEELWEVNVDGQNGFYVLTEYDDSHYSYNNVVEYVNGEGKMIPNRLNGLGDLYDE